MMGNPSFPADPPFPGSERPRPRVGASPRPLLSESSIGGSSSAGDTEGRRVGRAWHGRGAEGGRVAHRRAGAECRAGHTVTGIFFKDPFRNHDHHLHVHHHNDRYRAELICRDGKEWIEDGHAKPRSRLTIENRAKYHSISTSC